MQAHQVLLLIFARILSFVVISRTSLPQSPVADIHQMGSRLIFLEPGGTSGQGGKDGRLRYAVIALLENMSLLSRHGIVIPLFISFFVSFLSSGAAGESFAR